MEKVDQEVNKIRNRKKWILLIAIAVICIAIGFGVYFWSNRAQRLSSVIDSTLKESDWTVTHIEEMEIDKEPILVSIDDAVVKDNIRKIFNETDVRHVRKEVGMVLESILYTVTVSGEENAITLTFDENNQLHLNQSENTYLILSDNVNLYQFIKDQFQIIEIESTQ